MVLMVRRVHDAAQMVNATDSIYPRGLELCRHPQLLLACSLQLCHTLPT